MRALKVIAVTAMIAAAFAGLTRPAASAELVLWSMYAAEKIKRDYVQDAINRFEAANPGVKIKAQWYEKTALYAAMKTALRAGQAPDIFYAEPDQTEYMENKLLLDLSAINWNNVEPWAKQAWSYKGKPYGVPLEAWTVELYYNKAMLKDLGIQLPANSQLSADAFVDMVKKARAKGITPMSLGVGDRPFPGAHLTHEVLLQRLGVEDYDKLLKGNLDWTDPRVVEALKWVRSLTEIGLLPTSFTSLKLGEAHTFFHTNPGALTFLNGSYYTSRAFNTPDKGGQAADFPLGIMRFPAVPNAVCLQCKTITVGGSYVVNASTKHPKEAVAFLNTFATPDMGMRWLEDVLSQTTMKIDVSKVKSQYADYFKELLDANKEVTYYFGIPTQVMQGKRREVFVQVINSAFPAGSISVDDAVKQMQAVK